jgi:CubicO group peptidase (beta-lactamase class C family)
MIVRPGFLVFALLLVSTRAAAVDPKTIINYVEKTRVEWGVPGMALAVVKDGKPVVIQGFGVREMGKPEKMDADTVFSLASVSKHFTATAAAVAVTNGKITWDQPVVHSLPEFKLYDPYLTAIASFRDLLANRTGVAEHSFISMPYNGLKRNRREQIAQARHDQPAGPFRSTWEYHNILYSAAGEALGEAVGMSWDDYLRTALFEPLGMRSTTTTARELASAPNRATSHIRSRDLVLKAEPFRPDGWWTMDNHAAAGAINSTANDMAKWLEFQLGDGTFRGKRIASEEALDETHLGQVTMPHGDFGRYTAIKPHAYAMGWNVVQYGSERLLLHTGSFRGHATLIFIVPERNLGIFLFANSRDVRWASMDIGIAQWITDRYVGNAVRDWATGQHEPLRKYHLRRQTAEKTLLELPEKRTQPAASKEAYVGTYRNALEAEYKVSVENGVVKLDRLGMSEPYFATLEHWNGEAYRTTWNETLAHLEPGQLVSFNVNPWGEVRSLYIYIAGAADGRNQAPVEFFKVIEGAAPRTSGH